jgi:hypothetical protein
MSKSPQHITYPDTDGFFTRKETDDPNYLPGSYFESMGFKGYGHNTNIYDPNGSLLHQTEPGAVQEASRNYVLERWDKR